MKYRCETADLAGRRFRVTHSRRRWWHRWRLIGVESWCPCPGDNHTAPYAYTAWKAVR